MDTSIGKPGPFFFEPESKVPTRLAWADVAKGTCMVLVVSVHVTNKHFLILGAPYPVSQFWDLAGASLAPLRMPLFFLVSGILASRAVCRPWADVYRTKIAQPYYLYIVWLFLAYLVYQFLGSSIDGEQSSTLEGLFSNALLPTTSLWYLYALSLYFIVAKLGVRRNQLCMIGGAFVLAIFISFWPVNVPLSVASNLVFFLVGAYYPKAFTILARHTSLRKVMLAVLAYASVLGVYALGGADYPGVRPVTSCVAVLVGILTISVLTRWVFIRRVGSYVGRHTLAIYVLHVPLLAVLTELWPWRFDSQEMPWVLSALYPPAVVAVLILLAIGLRQGLTRIGLQFLFSVPIGRVRSSRAGLAKGTSIRSERD